MRLSTDGQNVTVTMSRKTLVALVTYDAVTFLISVVSVGTFVAGLFR